jgi:hypothetical protein
LLSDGCRAHDARTAAKRTPLGPWGAAYDDESDEERQLVQNIHAAAGIKYCVFGPPLWIDVLRAIRAAEYKKGYEAGRAAQRG